MTGGLSPICHLKSFHPQDDHYGLSPLQAAAVAIDVHNCGQRLVEGAAGQRRAAFGGDRLQGRGRAGGAVAGPVRAAGERDGERIIRARAMPGGRCCWKAGSTGSRWGSRPRDMEFQQTKEAAAREIAIAFGVPPMLLGIPGDATYANYQEANRAFYRLTVLPLATQGAGGDCRTGCRPLPARRSSCGPTWTRCRRWRRSATSNGRGWARRIS